MAPAAIKRIQRPALTGLRGVGRLMVGAPEAPRATGGYGLACQGALLLLFLIGLAVSWPLPGVGLAIMIVSALALLQYFVLRYRGALLRLTTIAWLAAVSAVAAIVIGLVWASWDASGGRAGDVMVLTAGVVSLLVLPTVRFLFRMIFGPHHPESTSPEPKDPPPLWFWTGGVHDDRAEIVARVDPELAPQADAVVVEYHDGERSHRSPPVRPDEHRFARVSLTGLRPDTAYALRVLACRGTEVIGLAMGSVTTFPTAGRPATFTLAFASCMSTGSRGQVFDTIRELQPKPRLFTVTGDLHYENLTSDRADDFLDAYDMIHRSHPQRRLYGSTAFAYLWDDHDFGDNDCDHSSRSRQAAQTAYRLAVPHYPGPIGSEAIHQELTIGRTRMLLTDNRSERGEVPGHLLSPATEEWLVQRITDPAWPLVVWVSPTPWISDEDGSDNWGAYGEQRQRIASAIGSRAANLVMVSGDAHMVAIDDGTNSAYAGPGSGFPVLHAAALDRSGSTKGGPFTHGRFPGSGQFGVVTIDDRGDEIAVTLSGRNWTGAEIIGHSFTIDVHQRS